MNGECGAASKINRHQATPCPVCYRKSRCSGGFAGFYQPFGGADQPRAGSGFRLAVQTDFRFAPHGSASRQTMRPTFRTSRGFCRFSVQKFFTKGVIACASPLGAVCYGHWVNSTDLAPSRSMPNPPIKSRRPVACHGVGRARYWPSRCVLLEPGRCWTNHRCVVASHNARHGFGMAPGTRRKPEL